MIHAYSNTQMVMVTTTEKIAKKLTSLKEGRLEIGHRSGTLKCSKHRRALEEVRKKLPSSKSKTS